MCPRKTDLKAGGLPAGVWLLSGVSLLNDVASEAIYPLLPFFLTTVLGATAMSLGGGSGWVVIAHAPLTNDLRIIGTGGHSQALAAGTPIFVLDMFEHAYAIDYGPNKEPYLDAFFKNLAWAEVARRLEAALARA